MTLRTLTITLLLAALLVPAASSATGHWVFGSLETSERVLVEGSTTAETRDGVVHLRTHAAELSTLTLAADALTVTTAWERGVVATPGGIETRYHEASGTETVHHTDATLTLTAVDAHPEVLVALEPGARAAGQAPHVASLQAIRDQHLTRAEWSGDTHAVGEGEPAGFWYEVEGADVALTGLRMVQVDGDALLFLNNVTFAIESGGEVTETWTGYRESSSQLPATWYESRITTIDVRGGLLTLRSSASITLVGSPLTVEMNGTATANRVEGVLNGPGLRYDYTDSRLELSGVGALTVLSKDLVDASPRLSLHPEGRYDVHRTPGLVATPFPSDQPGEVNWAWASGGILGIFVLAALLGARTRIMASVDTWRATWAERSIATWMGTGDKLTQVRDFRGAARWYRRVAKKHPHFVEAWYSLGASLIELERFDDAANAYLKANKLLGGDDPELLDLAAMASWRAGANEEATDLFVALAQVDPDRAARRLSDPDLKGLRRDQRVVRALTMPDDATTSYV